MYKIRAVSLKPALLIFYGPKLALLISPKHHPWQPCHYIHALQTDMYDAQKQVEDIARLPVFGGPMIGVVADLALFMHRHLVTLHDPFDGRFAIDDVAVGGLGYALDVDVPIVVYDAAVGVFVAFGKAHLFDAVIGIAGDDHGHFGRRRRHCFVTDMQRGKGATGAAEWSLWSILFE